MKRGWSSILAMAGASVVFLAAVSGRAQDTSGGGSSGPPAVSEGKEIYEQICQACHMADARGGGGAGAQIPALAGNANLKDPKFIITILLKGRGGMPWFTEMLTPAQMAAVATYVRGHFNSYPDPISEADVKAVAASLDGPGKPDCMTCGN
ncbi:MAG TPA: cytochrome c [Sphingobium sp.]|uniref:c-type cytochrome n=1 Tax=Sphingobium sp. TaxID=1912891 RepID=UPI002ED57A5F